MTDHTPPTEAQFAESRALFVKGVEHFESGRLEPACICFEKCQALTPGRVSVLRNLGVSLFLLKRWDEAIPVLRQATAIDAALADAWACLGLANEARRDWQAAAEALKKAVALTPQQAPLWLTLGQVCLRLGDAKNALQAFDRALEEDPSSAPAWSDRGNLLRELQQFEEAARCYEKAIALGGDPGLNRYYLASVRGGDKPLTPPRRYVETLFDDYATDFQSHAVETLRYRGYEVLLRPLLDRARRYQHVLDLGCGTGLCGQLIAPRAETVDGVDVSSAMLAEARKLGIYRELIHGDLAEVLAATPSRFDLILAADVFIYVGDLAPIFRAVRRILEPEGCFAFTVELAKSGEDIQLLPSLRYAHSEAYVRGLADEAGLSVVNVFEAPIRHDQTTPIMGLYFYLT